MRYRGEHTPDDHKMGLSLRATCKQIHEETEKFFFRNTFSMSLSKEFKTIQKYICNNVQKVTWDWVGFSLKDQQLFDCLNYSCPKLKFLNLQISWLTVDNSDLHRRRQYSHRDVPEAKRFKNTGGFDALVSLRGLELVTVTRRECIHNASRATITQKEVDNFAAWLNTLVTLEKYQPPARASIAKKVEVTASVSFNNVFRRLTANALHRRRPPRRPSDELSMATAMMVTGSHQRKRRRRGRVQEHR